MILVLSSIAMNARAIPYSPTQATVELHAHLFMDEALTWLFRGDLFSPLQAKDWQAGFLSQANEKTLNESGIGILVAALYVHPLTRFSMKEALQDQIHAAKKFISRNPNWVLGLSAGQAIREFDQGKRILILSLEGASGALETEADLDHAYKEGIRIVTPLHLTDDEFGGVALLKGTKVLASPFAWIRSLLHGKRNEGVRVNDQGLTPRGEKLVRRLLKRKIWVDLAHASDLSQKRIQEIFVSEVHDYPSLYTHTVMRKYHGAERGISQSQLQLVQKSRGILGLMPCQPYLKGTGGACPQEDGGVHSFLKQYQELTDFLTQGGVYLGSDTNAGISHLPPPQCPTHGPLDPEGYWHLGQSDDLWNTLENLWEKTRGPRRVSAQQFLKTWKRVHP